MHSDSRAVPVRKRRLGRWRQRLAARAAETLLAVGLGVAGTAVPAHAAGATLAYVANSGDNTVSVIDTSTNAVTATIAVGAGPYGIAVQSASTITPFPFTGFFAPVVNPPTLNQVNAGQAIPMKFTLGGDQGLNVIASGYPTATRIGCTTGVPVNTATLTDTAGGSGLNYDPGSGTYTYVWKTSKAWSGTCQQFTMTLTDGTTHTAEGRRSGRPVGCPSAWRSPR